MAKLQLVLTRQEELELLAAQNERIRKDPAYGLYLMQKAGIYDANGQLTEHYRSEPQDEEKKVKVEAPENRWGFISSHRFSF